MANIKQIKRRIKSAQNISKITRAMEMVAASKMKKAQDRALMSKPYTEKIASMTRELARSQHDVSHPLLSSPSSSGNILLLLITTNKGLAGGLHTNIFRMLSQWIKGKGTVAFVTVGKKGQGFVSRHGFPLLADFSENTPFYQHIPPISSFVIEKFLTGEFREVYIVYTVFESALRQSPVVKPLLPLSQFFPTGGAVSYREDHYLIEPHPVDVFRHLLPHYVENQIRNSIFEAEASEHSARMIAMRNATDAALDLVDALTLVYNKVRQDGITNEIADIVTARMAVA